MSLVTKDGCATTLERKRRGPHRARSLALWGYWAALGCAVSEQAELLDQEPVASAASSSGGTTGDLSGAASTAGAGTSGGLAGSGGAGKSGANSPAGCSHAAGGVGAGGESNPAGGASAGSPSFAGAAGAPGACTPGATLAGAPINDSEALNAQGNDYIQTTSSGWFLYFDEGHAGTIAPSASMPLLGVVAGNGGSVFRVTGTALAVDFWGAGAGLWVSPCVDTTAVTGVTFWLKSDRPVVVSVMTPATTPVSGGGTCTGPCIANSAASLPAKPQGETVMLPLTSFAGGSAALDRSRITGVIFTINAPGGAAWSFDVQLDDLGVY